MFHNPTMAFRSLASCACLPLLMALWGCNGQAADGGSDGGVAASGNAGAAGASGVAGSGGDGGGSAGTDCSAFEDDLGWSVLVSIVNRTSQVIHVGQTEVTCTNPPLFVVEDDTGDPLTDLSGCRTPCDAVMDGNPAGCPGICLFPQAVTLEPDEGTNVIWSGLRRREVRLPEQCLPMDEPVLVSTCDFAVQIEPGTFTFTAQAGTELDCLQTTGTCGECMTRGEGGCATSATIAGTMLSAEVTVGLDASYGVGNVANGAIDIGSTLPVEIVFSD
jgi:hypothetical protein